jgi:hypothetical protein
MQAAGLKSVFDPDSEIAKKYFRWATKFFSLYGSPFACLSYFRAAI